MRGPSLVLLTCVLAIVPLLALSGCSSYDCPTGLVKCGGQCVSITSDEENCGACGNACGSGMVCSHGVCDETCPETPVFFTDCDGECVDLRTDPDNCGMCNNACLDYQVCYELYCVPYRPYTPGDP